MVALILFIIFIGSKISIGRIIILACLFHNFNTTTKSVQSIDVNKISKTEQKMETKKQTIYEANEETTTKKQTFERVNK